MARERQWTPDWSVFDAFPRAPITARSVSLLSWENTVAWIEESRSSAAAELESIQPLLRAWDDALASLGGDPSRDDWDSFRPLRLSREEDWSDWLAYLLTGNDGARVAAKLFSPASPAPVVEQAVREAVVSDGERRADLVLLWSGGRASHVEVKIWDENFAKTAETGLGCRRLFADRRDWIDYVLLPDESEAAWRESTPTNDIRVVTWTALCSEFRRALLGDRESVQWRAFARAFCGSAEQKILGTPRMTRERPPQRASVSVFTFGRVIREARDHGDGFSG